MNTSSMDKNLLVNDDSSSLLKPISVKNISDKPNKPLQILHNAQIGVHVPNSELIKAVDQYLKDLRHETKNYSSATTYSNNENNLMIPLLKTTKTSLEQTVENMVTYEFVEKLRKSFQEADTNNTGYLDVYEFTIFMRQLYPDITNREAEIIFLKIDTNCDGEVDLSEYLTYILFEHQSREIMYNMSKPMPYPYNPKEFTFKSLSLDLYINFQFLPGKTNLDEIDYTYGRYISITRYGLISHWSNSLKLIHESKIQSIEHRKQTLPLWITCMCLLPDMNYIVVGTTERDLIFYDINSHTYIGSIIINDFPSSLTTIDYRMNRKNSCQSAIFCGDSLGNLFIIHGKESNKTMFHISDRTNHINNESIRIYSFPRIVNNEYSSVSVIRFCNLHYDWIVQIKWINDLNLFVSCALTSKKSLFIGDLDKKTEKYAEIKKGFAVFDYSKVNQTIVTGGNDGVIYIWDPFVTERATAMLHGHDSSLTHLVVDNRENHIISIDKEKNIIIWDIQTLKILQQISHTILELSNQDLTIFCLNPSNQTLILGHKKLLSLTHNNQSHTSNDRTSHLSPITKILYNPLFDIILSSDENSVINIWNIRTGEKLMHILNAHLTQFDRHPVEITAMCLDETKRRLITGAYDGSLALWNFNNGQNLYRIDSNDNDGKEITVLLHDNERLFVAGWSRRIRVFHLGKSVIIRQVDEFRSLHNDDILSMNIMINILATASYDGDIILWTIETGMPFMKLNSFENIKPQLLSLSWVYKQTTKGAIESIIPKYSSRRKIKKYQKRSVDNTEGLRQNLLNQLRTNYETSVESVLKPHNDQSTISSDYHLDQLIFLHKRETNPLTANLITAGSRGWIWWWSTHVIGGLLAVFNGARKPQEDILAMCIDEQCNILFTSDTAGYVALWFIGDYACKPVDSEEKQRILTKFAFGLQSTIPEIQEMKNQVEQKLRNDLGTPLITMPEDRDIFLTSAVIYPQLLIAYRAHLRPIISIIYANDREILLTSSIDCTIRLFTLTGRYIGFMDQSIPFGPLNSIINLKDLPKQIPEDIRRQGSATTLEIVRGDIGKRWKLLKHTIVAWTSLPIFHSFYQNKTLDEIPKELPAKNETRTSTISHLPKTNIEDKQEWIERRERLYRLIGLDRQDTITNSQKPTVESMLKTQRENFGITMPVLGQFVRKYMHHRPTSNFPFVPIQHGKAIIYSLLPLVSICDETSWMRFRFEESPENILPEYFDTTLNDEELNQISTDDSISKNKISRTKRQICPSITLK